METHLLDSPSLRAPKGIQKIDALKKRSGSFATNAEDAGPESSSARVEVETEGNVSELKELIMITETIHLSKTCTNTVRKDCSVP